MKTMIHFNVGGRSLVVRTGSGLARGLAAAAIRYGWLHGRNMPVSARAAERAAWAALRARKTGRA